MSNVSEFRLSMIRVVNQPLCRILLVIRNALGRFTTQVTEEKQPAARDTAFPAAALIPPNLDAWGGTDGGFGRIKTTTQIASVMTQGQVTDVLGDPS